MKVEISDDKIQIGQFLTFFQSKYLPSSSSHDQLNLCNKKEGKKLDGISDDTNNFNEESDGFCANNNITGDDVQSALTDRIQFDEYLQLLREINNRKDIEEENQFESSEDDELLYLQQELIKHIEKNWQNREHNFEMQKFLQRFEVFSTKALSEKLLCVPHCSHSNLLSFPSATHVEEINKNKNSDNASNIECKQQLLITPNSLTWREFLRISIMVGSLPTSQIEKASDSPLCGNPVLFPKGSGKNKPKTKQKSSSSKLLLAEDSIITAPDLVALWVRAQRNGGALRHLLHLFTIEKKEMEDINDNGKEYNQSENLPEEYHYMEKQYKYKAKFVGNSNKTRAKVVMEADTLDSLVQFVVTNQMLSSYDYYQDKEVRSNRKMKSSYKKKREIERVYSHVEYAEEIEGTYYSRKKKKTDNTIQMEDICLESPIKSTDSAFRSRRCFILRWFCRRNRNILSVLFSSHFHKEIEIHSPDRSEILKKKSSWDHIQSRIKSYMRNFGTTDRTFARIDRRIFTKYDNDSDFCKAVEMLLKALRDCVADEHYDDVQKSIQDFSLLRRKFLINHENSALLCPSLPCDENVDENTNSSHILATYPPPWIDQCQICKKAICSQDEKLLCRCCGYIYHKKCCPFTSDQNFTKANRNVIKKFGSKREYSWGTKIETVIFCEDKIKHGAISWGLSLAPSEEFSAELALMFAGSWSSDFQERTSSAYFHLKYAGLVVTSVAKSAEDSGLQVGDLIIRIIDLDSKEIYEIGSMTKRDIIFDRIHDKLHIVAHRPLRPIFNIFDQKQKTQYCRKCAVMTEDKIEHQQQDSGLKTESQTILSEAMICRAVIRRLGMEWSSRPFHYENWNDPSSFPYISLRRLDLMMTSIITKHSKRSDDSGAAQLLNPFLEPSIGNLCGKDGENDERKKIGLQQMSIRISWAPDGIEHRPTELLCLGLQIILGHSAKSDDFDKGERKDLMHRFLPLLKSWCFDGQYTVPRTDMIESSVEIRNSQDQALHSFAPWTHESCKVCGVNKECQKADHIINGKLRNILICNNPFCKRFAKKYFETKKLNETELRKEIRDHKRRRYGFHYWSSFVGSMVLVTPGDPLHLKISVTLKQSIEHMDRPIEVLVLSFSPTKLGGMFLVIPIISHVQIHKTLEYFKSHGIPVLSNNECFAFSHESSLPKQSGMYSDFVQFTHTEMEYCIRESLQIRGAVDHTVFKLSSSSFNDNESNSTLNSRKADISDDGQDSMLALSSSDHYCTENPNLFSLYSLAFFEDVENTPSFVETQTRLFSWSRFSAPENAIIASYLKEYIALIDNLCFSESGFIRRFLVEIICARESMCSEVPLESRTFIQHPELDTDIGENSDDIIESHAFSRPCNENDSIMVKNPLRLHNTEIHFHVCYIDFTSSERMPHGPPPICNNSSLSNSNPKTMIIILSRSDPKIARSNLEDSPSSGDSDWDPNEGDQMQRRAKLHQESRPKQDTLKFKGSGWGLELVKWSCDKRTLRVGRVVPNSPAHQANILPHDIVISINGKNVRSIGPDTAVARSMLWNNRTKDPPNLQVCKNGINPGLQLMRKLSEPVKGPVVLEIVRPLQHPPISQRIGKNLHQKQPNTLTANIQGHAISKDRSNKSQLSSFPSSNREEQNFQQTLPSNQMLESTPLRPYHHLPLKKNKPDSFHSANSNISGYKHQSNQALLENNYEKRRAHNSYVDKTAPQGSMHLSSHSNPNYAINQDIYNMRPVLCPENLYSSGFEGSILTCAETVALIEASSRQQPGLGLRLLCPRYSSLVVHNEYNRLIMPKMRNCLHLIPRLHEDDWNSLLVADYRRSLSETGPIAFREKKFSYRRPHNILPIDRILESSMKNATSRNWNTQTRLSHTNLIASARASPYCLEIDDCNSVKVKPKNCSNMSAVIDLLDSDEEGDQDIPALHSTTQRIRGGGLDPGNVHDFKKGPIMLTSLDSSKWVGLPVYTRNITMAKNPVEIKHVGVIVELSLPDSVIVKVVHVSNIGYLSPCIIQKIAINMLYIVEQSSEENHLLINQPNIQESKGDNVDAFYKNANHINELNKVIVEKKKDSELLMKEAYDHRQKLKLIYDTRQKITDSSMYSNFAIPSDHNANKNQSNVTEYSYQLSVDRYNDRKLSTSFKQRDINECFRALLDRLSHRLNVATPLGYLPDGRGLCWFPHDPKALYIRAPSKFYKVNDEIGWAVTNAIQRKYRLMIKRNSLKNKDGISLLSCTQGNYCCVWGCTELPSSQGSTTKGRRILSFSTREEYMSHMINFHSYQLNEDPTCDLDVIEKNSKQWTRVSEGKMICSLCSDLTAACCARSPGLLTSTQIFQQNDSDENVPEKFSLAPTQHRIIFKIGNIFSFIDGAKGSVYFNKVKHSTYSKSHHIKSLIRLWSRISRLFQVERDGRFRDKRDQFWMMKTSYAIRPDQYVSKIGHDASCTVQNEEEYIQFLLRNDKEVQQTQNKRSDSIVSNIHEKKLFQHFLPFDLQQMMQTKGQILSLDSYRLSLLPKQIYHSRNKMEEDMQNGFENSRSDERNPATATIQPRNKMLIPAIESLYNNHRKIDTCRLMLLRVANNVPDELQTKDPINAYHKNKSELFFWEKTCLDYWIAFVKNACNGRILMQAFIVLMSGIQTSKLPKWWKSARSGWKSALGSISNSSLSSLAVQLYTLDIALTQNKILIDKSPKLDTSASGKLFNEKIVNTDQDNPRYDFIPLEQLSKLNVEERMRHVLAWAKMLSLERFNGESNSECYICDTGGDLMCCEFCSNVQHIECCKPALEKFPDSDWVCDLCVADIVNLCTEYFQK